MKRRKETEEKEFLKRKRIISHFVIFFSCIMLMEAGDNLQRTFNTWSTGQGLLGHHLSLDVRKK